MGSSSSSKPVIRRPLAGAAPKVKTTNLLDRIQPVDQVDSGGIKVSLYGKAKTGKTRLISTFPGPIVIIGAEDGTRSVRNVDGLFFVKLLSKQMSPPTNGRYIYLEEFGDFIESVRDSEYQTIALDTASALADLVLADVLGIEQVPAQSSWGMATREQYGQQAFQLKTMMRSMLQLPQNVVITAHERNFSDEGNSNSELILPTIGSALSPSVAGWLNGACEYICQTFIRLRQEEKSTTLGVGKAAKTMVTTTTTDEPEYCLRVGPHPVYMTGFRLPPGFTLPNVIANPNYEKIHDVIMGK